MINDLILIAAYLVFARLTFWLLTRADWPKSTRWTCGRVETDSYNGGHSHKNSGCKNVRDLATSRRRRTALAYFWPAVLPVLVVFFTVAGVILGAHFAVTGPMTTHAEREERRLKLEQEVATAETEEAKARAEQEKL